MVARKKPLPKTIYVVREVDGNDQYLVAHESLYDASEKHETRTVGMYSLQDISDLTLLAKVTKVRKAA